MSYTKRESLSEERRPASRGAAGINCAPGDRIEAVVAGSSAAGADSAWPGQMSEVTFSRFAAFIERELGIHLAPSKRNTLENRLQRRLRQLGLNSFAAYERFVFANLESERTPLLDSVTTNKTEFFREPAHFDFLAKQVLGEWTEVSPMQIWSAGCSSGEEPYTLAMVTAEFERAGSRPRQRHEILATDISTKILEEARHAVYPEARIASVPLPLRARYLREGIGSQTGKVRIDAGLRARVRFQLLNLMAPHYGVTVKFKAIFCRNVMIYFNRPTQQAVVERLSRQLLPGGYLFIGHSESLLDLDVPVEIVRPSIYRKPE